MTLIAGVAVIGTGFGVWTGALDVGGTVNTGHVSLEVVDAFTDDDGIVNQAGFDDEDDNAFNVQLFDGWSTSSSADPAGTGADPKDHSDKDVGRCSTTVVSASTVSVTKDNVYPGYNCTTWLDYTNTGSVPVRVRRVTVDGSFSAINVATSSDVLSLDLSGDSAPDADVALSNISPCQQIDPGATVRMDIEQSILQKAPQGSSLSYTVEVETAQWNELATSTDAITATYGAVKTIVGPGSVILPFNGAKVCHNADGSPDLSAFDNDVFMTVGAAHDLFDWSEAPNLFDTQPSSEGIIPVVSLNGSDEYALTPDAAHWSFGDGVADSPFSIGAWINLANVTTTRVILSRFDGASSDWEWWFFVNDGDTLTFDIFDDSEGVQVRRRTVSAIAEEEWLHVVATYDGGGGPTAMDGATLYINGAVVPSTASDSRSYVAMEHRDLPTSLGSVVGGGWTFQGMMAGGPVGPFVVPKELTATDVADLYQIGLTAMDLP